MIIETHQSKRGGARPGAGRKPLEPTESRSIRLKVATWERLEQEAAAAGQNLTGYILGRLTEPAKPSVETATPQPAAVLSRMTLRQAWTEGLSIQRTAELTGYSIPEVKKAHVVFASGKESLISGLESGTLSFDQAIKELKQR